MADFEGVEVKRDIPTGDRRNNFEGLTPQEINFITHPMWRTIEERFKEDPDSGFVIEQHGEPVAVIIDYKVMEKLKHDLKNLERAHKRRRRHE